MPSTRVLGDTANGSGGQPLISGNYWSGNNLPTTELRIKAAGANSGSVYIGFSGGPLTINSGGHLASGGGNDGWELRPGEEYRIPKGVISGRIDRVFTATPLAASGFVRVFWEAL